MKSKKIKLLFLSALPKAEEWINLKGERDAIEEAIISRENHDLLEFIDEWAVSCNDLMHLLAKHRPTIVHFTGHGGIANKIQFVGEEGETETASNESLMKAFKIFKENVKIVFLNACMSEKQAKSISEAVDCAIGVPNTIGKLTSTEFASCFYYLIGLGYSIQKAYDAAVAHLALTWDYGEENMPLLLFDKNKVDPNKIIILEDIINYGIEKNNLDSRTISIYTSNKGSEGLQNIIERVIKKKHIEDMSLDKLVTTIVPEGDKVQITEIGLAQKSVAEKGIPITAEASYKLGMLNIYSKDYKTAIDYFHQSIRADEVYPKAFETIAELQQVMAMQDLSNEDFSSAIENLDKAREVVNKTDPLDAHTLALRGYIFKTIAQVYEAKAEKANSKKFIYYSEATRLFGKVIDLNPLDASGHNGIGNIYFAMGELDKAITSYSRAIDLAPDYAFAYHDLALAYDRKRQIEPVNAVVWSQKALATWTKAYELAKKDPRFSQHDLDVIRDRIESLELYKK